MTRPTYRFAFAGDVVESVIHPLALPLVDGEPTWTCEEVAGNDPCFEPWRGVMRERVNEKEGWADTKPEGLFLRFPQHANFLVERSGRRVCVAPDPVFTEYASHLLIDHVAPRRFVMLGEHVLHATCVALSTPRGERAIGLFGATGTGKSTFATYLVSRGARFVADDCLLLRSIPANRATVYAAIPSYAGARLWGDSVAGIASVGGALAEHATVASWGKGRLDLEAQFHTSPIPTEAVVKLVRSTDSSESLLERLSPSEATVTLVGTYFLNEKGGLTAAELLRRSSELARDLPVYRLTYPSGYEHLHRAMTVLADHFAFEIPATGPAS